jgi:drug/metabolite transporter (DMT)-like permease
MTGRGILLVTSSAVVWSMGGLIVRSLDTADSWTTVFWRSVTAAIFLVVVLTARDGRAGLAAIRRMLWPGNRSAILVAVCFSVSSIAFVVAVGLTTVANVLLIFSSTPLFAALLAWLVLGERISVRTIAAIAATMVGIGILVSDSYVRGSLAGSLVALIVPVCTSAAIVTMRRHREISMLPSMCVAAALGALIAFPFATPLAISAKDAALLTLFGAGHLGLGMVIFIAGAPLLPAATTALLGALETILGPLWVWLAYAEQPSRAALIGGVFVLTSLAAYALSEYHRTRPASVGGEHP